MTTTKHAATCLFILLISAILLSASSSGAYAQDEFPPQVPNPVFPPTPPPQPKAIVVVVASVGGTTDPEPGTYTYTFADTITLKATANAGFRFLYWSVSGNYLPGHGLNQPPIVFPSGVDPENPGNFIPEFPSPSDIAIDNLVISQNPLTVVCGYGYTYQYQPVFVSTAAPEPGNNSIAIVLAGTGGTTDPAPGTYTYPADQDVVLTATPNSGFEFLYWVATSDQTAAGHGQLITDSSLEVNCQQGYTFTYQPVFKPVEAAVPSGVDPTYFYVVIAILAIVAVAAIAFALMRGKK
jgi:hypothetical protein